jgi:hypothetical protein
MSCAFDLDHYRELLDATRSGGYTFGTFEGEPSAGHVYLRHDVDLSLDAALEVAQLEAAAETTATYFLMTRSVFYNLDSLEGIRAIDRLRELGHQVAHHPVHPYIELDGRFDAVLACHWSARST